MNSLSNNWFIEGRIDFEFKKYTLLSYLQHINKQFHTNKLYPELADLVFHYNNLVSFKQNKDVIYKQFPARISKANIDEIKIIYQKIVEDDEMMKEIQEIINYAIDEMDDSIQEGKELYDFVEKSITVFPIGLVPLYPYSGYMFLVDPDSSDTKVYEYNITIFENQTEKYRGINTTYVNSYERNFINTFENIKADLIRNKKDLPNPAVYGVETSLSFPLDQTLLPIAKKSLVKYLAAS